MHRNLNGAIRACLRGFTRALVLVVFLGTLSPAQQLQLTSPKFYSVSEDTFFITAGPDGALWFTEWYPPQIGRITPSGSVTEFPCPFANCNFVESITAGPDGALWFIFNRITDDSAISAIGRLTTAGAFSEYSLPTGANPFGGIVAGPDGALWFGEGYSRLYIGRITTAGQITEYPLPANINGASSIAAGSDGALWFTESGSPSAPYTDHIGRITTTGQITVYSTPKPTSGPFLITSGPDGALWFFETSPTGTIGRVTISGLFTEFATPGISPRLMVSGPDGALWLNGQDMSGRQVIARMTTAGTLTISAPLLTGFQLPGMTFGPDNHLWLTDTYRADVVQMVIPTSGPVTTGTVTGTAGNFGWYTSALGVALSATDSTSPITATYFNIDGGPYQKYVNPFIISGDGNHTYSYYSVDAAGRQEIPNSQSVKIDVTKPISLVQPFPRAFGVLQFAVGVAASDATSGLSSISLYVSDNGGPFGLVGAQSVFGNTYATNWSQSGTCGHSYGYYSLATDLAGNQENPKSSAEAITPASVPSSKVAGLAANTSLLNFLVRWSGVSNCGAIGSYTVYASDNGGPFTPWISQTSSTQATFAGILGHTYGFFSIALDSAGAQEPMKYAAEATTRIVNGLLADVNGDGKVDCADVSMVKALTGKRTGQAGFDVRADLNRDGIIDVRDLAAVTQALSAGTVCP
jgi:virginiamycin B lyase